MVTSTETPTKEEQILALHQANIFITPKEISAQVKVSREYISKILKRHNLPTKSLPKLTNGHPCPECNHRWLRLSIREKAFQCRNCNCYFAIEDGIVRVVRHRATYTENKGGK
jgi:uncharacterized protein YbaR (Trm112 family)